VGDHAVNIAEDIVFIEQGEDIRHLHESGEGKRKAAPKVAPVN